MPKRKDKSFELMASIGGAKNPLLEVSLEKEVVNAKERESKLNQKKRANLAKSSPSNIPYVPPSLAVKKQLKKLAFEEETSMTALISEGLDYVFKERGLKTIDQLTESNT